MRDRGSNVGVGAGWGCRSFVGSTLPGGQPQGAQVLETVLARRRRRGTAGASQTLPGVWWWCALAAAPARGYTAPAL